MRQRMLTLLRPMLLIVSAPLVAIVTWMFVGPQYRFPDTLYLRFQSDVANYGKISWQRATSDEDGVIVAYADSKQLTESTYPVTITFEPLPSANPAAKGNEVWIFDITTKETRTPDWRMYHDLPAPWQTVFDQGVTGRQAIMFPGETPKSFVYHTKTSDGKIFLSMLQHPWSGMVRVTINGRSQEYDLYSAAASLKVIRLDSPRFIGNTSQLEVSKIPAGQTTLRWYLADQPSTIKLSGLSLYGSRRWEWAPSAALPRMGSGARVIANSADGLVLTVDDPPNAWVEFNNLPPARTPISRRRDLLVILALSGCIWLGMLLAYLWQVTGRARQRWLKAGVGIVPIVLLGVALCAPILAARAQSADETTHFGAETVVQGLEYPTGFAYSADGRMFVIEKGGFNGVGTGRVKIFRQGAAAPTTALELPVCANTERGLVGMALDPNFVTNGYLYLFYTRQLDNCSVGSLTRTSPRNRVSRFTVAGDTIARSSEVVLIDDIPSVTGAHNAGGMRFGPDGMLYIGTGEGDTGDNAQQLSSLGGKILRIVPNPADIVPADNPFAKDADRVKRLVWAYGFRNPYRFGIDPRNGMVLIGDVGSAPPKAREEIDLGVPGGNYGWPRVEGIPSLERPEFVAPIYAYEHDNACNSVTGGVFITSIVYPVAYHGNYFFGDFSCGSIWRMQLDRSGKLLKIAAIQHNLAQHPVHFEQGPDGYLYFADIGGTIQRLVYNP